MNTIKSASLWKVFIAIPVALVIGGFHFWAEPSPWEVQQLLVNSIYGDMKIDGFSSYLPIMQKLAFLLVFNILYANEISNHFRHSCVYVFSRQKTRRHWYLCQVGKLALCSFGFICLYVLAILIRSIARSAFPVNSSVVSSMALIIVFSFIITFTSTLTINLFAISWGTARAFGIVQIVLCIFIIIYILTYQIPLLCAINPVSFLRFLSHPSWVVAGTLVTNILLAVGIIGKGMGFVEQFDVALFDPENN